MKTVVTEKLITDIINVFNQIYPQYKDEMKVFTDKDNELTFSFRGVNHVTELSQLYHDYGLENWKDEELFCLNITDLFSYLVASHEKDSLGDTLEELTENIKTKLIEISQKTDIDMNTLWESFKGSMKSLEKDIKENY